MACDSNPTLAASIRERYGVTVFESLDAALTKAKPTATVICTPAHLHMPMALRLLKAGHHLLIEKPLAIETSLVDAVRDAIADAQRFVGIAYVYHLMPWIVGARNFLLGGSLGRILQASVVIFPRSDLPTVTSTMRATSTAVGPFRTRSRMW
jgi:predicted dehydrogenase